MVAPTTGQPSSRPRCRAVYCAGYRACGTFRADAPQGIGKSPRKGSSGKGRHFNRHEESGRQEEGSHQDKGYHVKVTIDFDVCASTGACMQMCPEVFEVRSDGYLYLLQEEPGEELRASVQAAADMCPTAAITVEG